MQIYQPSRLPPASNFRVCERERHEECAGLIFQSERATESERGSESFGAFKEETTCCCATFPLCSPLKDTVNTFSRKSWKRGHGRDNIRTHAALVHLAPLGISR